LCKLEALNSIGLVGPEPDKRFKNYKQLYHVVVENVDKIKREASKKKATKESIQEVINNLVIEAQSIKDWNQSEKIQFRKTLAGTVGTEMIVTPEIQKYLNKANIKSIDHYEQDPDASYWAIVQSSKLATTKTGKQYLKLALIGESSNLKHCFIWNYKEESLLPENCLVLSKFKKSDFGFSANPKGFQVIENNNDDE